MNNKPARWLLIILTILVSVSLACSAASGGEPDSSPAGGESGEVPTSAPPMTDVPIEPMPPETTEPPPPTEKPPEPPSVQGQVDTNFPLPDDVQNFMQLDENSINFQTTMSLEEVVQFYRETFTAQGLTERTLLTVIEDEGVSMVFDGAPNNMAIVLQCVDLGGDSTNVNLRYEDV